MRIYGNFKFCQGWYSSTVLKCCKRQLKRYDREESNQINI